MELEGSLPHSQVPANCRYLEPVRSSPCPTSHILKIHINIILPPAPGFPKWSLSIRSPHQNLVYTSPLPHTCYMPRLTHSPRIDHPNKIGWAVQIIKFLIMQFSPFPVISSLLGSNILLKTLFSNTLSLRSSLHANDQLSHPYKTTGRIVLLWVLYKN